MEKFNKGFEQLMRFVGLFSLHFIPVLNSCDNVLNVVAALNQNKRSPTGRI